MAERLEDVKVPDILAVLPTGDNVMYPFMVLPLVLSGERWGQLIDEVSVREKMVGLFAQKPAPEKPPGATDSPAANPAPDQAPVEGQDLQSTGTAAMLARMVKLPDGTIQVLLQGVARVRLDEITQREPYLKGFVKTIPEVPASGVEAEGLTRTVRSQFQRVVQLAPGLPQEIGITAMNIDDPGRLADFAAANINLTLAEKQEVLETADVAVRLKRVAEFLNREIEILEVGSKIQEQIRGQMDKTQREYYLREQLKAIQAELGESDERTAEMNDLRQRIDAAGLTEEALKEANREYDRLAKMPPQAAEYTVSRTYLDWLVTLPWNKSTPDTLDLHHAREVLDADHYDLDKVKDRILDYLAVRQVKQDMRGPILCLAGPPGVGKTSLGQSIAKATGRKFYRLSLGGMRDEAEIRGHRRTYIGSMPGRIIQAIRQVDAINPVLMLDEVDKLGADFRGDPASALLEVLDPEQNSTFTDHYLDVPFDLSRVMFITTANMLDTIPSPLRDRMEIIPLPGYSEYDKLEIARRYLVPKQLAENGLEAGDLVLPDPTLRSIADWYTREAGVRGFERSIGTVCRKVSRRKMEGTVAVPLTIAPEDLEDYLGHRIFRREVTDKEDEIGVVTGLAWTEAGGDVLFVEASMIPGHGNLQLTGNLGEVMQESARAALTYARSRAEVLGLSEDFWQKEDLHVHVPAGAVPKDGPSAGVTMATAIISAMTRRPANRLVAMTGEITLHGRVLPIGGLKEKVLAAHRAGVTTVCLPRENEPDLDDLPAEVRNALRFIPVDQVDQILEVALKPAPSLVATPAAAAA